VNTRYAAPGLLLLTRFFTALASGADSAPLALESKIPLGI